MVRDVSLVNSFGGALIVADASEPLASQRAWPYHVPGWAFIRSLLRIVNIQQANTVEPRLEPMKHRQIVRMTHRKGDTTPDVDIVVRLSDNTDRLWETFRLVFYPDRMLSDKAPQYGMDTLVRAPKEDLFEVARGDVYIGTHLDRVHPDKALALLARGYVNAFLWTYELKPFGTEDAERLATVSHRLHEMVKKPGEIKVSASKGGIMKKAVGGGSPIA